MNSTVGVIAAAVLLLATLAGVFTLAWHGSITGGEALTAVGGIAAVAGGAFSVHAGVKVGAQAATQGTDSKSGP